MIFRQEKFKYRGFLEMFEITLKINNMTFHLSLFIRMHSMNANLSGIILLCYRITADLFFYCVN